MQLLCVPPARAQEFWPVARKYIDAAMDRVGLQSARDVEYDVLTGQKLVWLVVARDRVVGAIVTSLVRDGTARVLEIVALGADLSAARPHLGLIAVLENYARAEGCVAVRIIGRRGWSRALSDYHTRALILEKAL
jgi:hypothetical protein